MSHEDLMTFLCGRVMFYCVEKVNHTSSKAARNGRQMVERAPDNKSKAGYYIALRYCKMLLNFSSVCLIHRVSPVSVKEHID